MQRPDPHILDSQPVIRQLDDAAINRIAAGEVVERPASAVKELVENALDAGATRIDVTVADGGKTLIRVADDGCGITPEALPLALSRHATSKIDGTDLLNIHSFGFRGEALPSLGAVGRLSLTSRAKGHDAAEVRVSGGQLGEVKPAALNKGTVVELRDLFYATPARLKFLRTDRAEMQAVSDVVKRLAMAEPHVGFTLRDASGASGKGGDARVTFRADPETGDLFDALHGRLASILGREFAENALAIDATRDGIRMTGYAALPTYSRGAAVAQFLFVNGRPVKDKLLTGALRAAYFDFLSRDRHPAAALFLDCDPHLVDVNVHPAKSEVRFRDPGTARGLIVSGLRHALAEAGHRASTTVAGATLGAFRPEPAAGSRPSMGALGPAPQPTEGSANRVYQYDSQYRREAPVRPTFGGQREAGFAETSAPDWGLPSLDAGPSARFEPVVEDLPQGTNETPLEEHPLGAARAQLHENYIVAQTTRGMVVVDQHAAHERLVYEKLKRQMAENGVAAQALLIPEIIELSQGDAQRLLEAADDLARMGLVIEPFGGGAIAVRETPAILGEINAEALLRDVLDELTDQDDSLTLQARIEAILSRVACHGSIRSGRRMQVAEMNELLRQMEATPHSGQCNHGRPTYVELKLSDIERLFGRT
ncbi:DNA mismatch repair protein MutL [Pseudooceanicola marinus]|uniref:DNA mismatch repair protein MutL n=1 Tax=Pseudooceanicola marinus TaxID=396013 RepID=A0A1X6ZRT8_9RHOB|nr:DNA mismatch repair endonuclease MutL [Pseudooceanicola marinus]PJE30702.1 DNA mismatch repair endonuclease MutL [Pseudooceanicola marinus]SLN59737.1 DNA mismatch repair protein MutL [Pseudooceanicola marinus]